MKKVLYVEDNPSCVRLAQMFFQRSFPECTLDCATCSGEGLALLENTDYDLILLDFYLPDMNGNVFAHKAVVEMGFCGRIIYYSSQVFTQSDLPSYVTKSYHKPLNRKEFNSMVSENLNVHI